MNGGYSQTDVTTLAKHLNGWTVADESDIAGLAPQMRGSFRFEPRLSEGRTRRIFGMEFQPTLPEERYEGVVQALEMLAAHPSTARFISEKLAEHYVSDPAPPKLVKDLSRVYMQTNGDMKAMLMAIAEHPDFWSAPPQVATPQDFSFRFGRLCNATNTGAVNDFLNRSGMGLFDRATPDGYPEMDSNYVNSNILLQRWRFSETCRGQLIQMIPRAWINQDPAKVTNADAQRMIDLVAVRMTGRTLSDDSNTAALKFFEEAARRTTTAPSHNHFRSTNPGAQPPLTYRKTMDITRRYFLQSTGARSRCTAASRRSMCSARPASAPSSPSGAIARSSIIFLRGGMDGLNFIVPFKDPGYAQLRKSIRLADPGKENGVIDLDGFFGLNPRAGALADLFKAGHATALHAVGYSKNTRSHFEEQDVWETGVIGNTINSDGWLNRHLITSTGHGPVRAISVGDNLPASCAARRRPSPFGACRISPCPETRIPASS